MQADIIYTWMQERTKTTLPRDLAERLAALKKIVRGNQLQVIPLPGDTYLCVREDAKRFAHMKNIEATNIARLAGSIASTDYIAGTAVIVPRSAL